MSKGVMPPDRWERCASGPKNITAQSRPLAVRRTATRKPEGNCFGIKLSGPCGRQREHQARRHSSEVPELLWVTEGPPSCARTPTALPTQSRVSEPTHRDYFSVDPT